MPLLRRTPPSPDIADLLSLWEQTARQHLDFPPDLWHTASCRSLAAAVVRGSDPIPAVRRFAASRERACLTQSEAWRDLQTLMSSGTEAKRALDTAEVGASFVEAFRRSNASAVLESWVELPGSTYLAQRIVEEYRHVVADGLNPTQEITLWCVRLPWTDSAEDGLTSALEIADFLKQFFARYPVGCLTRSLFVVVDCPRWGGSGDSFDALPRTVRIWQEPLPPSPEQIPGLLSDLMSI